MARKKKSVPKKSVKRKSKSVVKPVKRTYTRRYVEPVVEIPPGTFVNQEVFLMDSVATLNAFAARVHKANHKWWHDPKTGKKLERNAGELIALIHSELSEALEGVRKGINDTHLVTRKMEEVEIADALIRLLDYAAGRGLDLHGAFVEKMAYNATRADHMWKNRRKPGGKKI